MQMAAILNLSRDCVCRCCWLAAAVWSWTAGTGRGRTRESSNHQQFKTDCQFVIHPLSPSCDDSSFSPLKDSRIRKVIWQFFFRANSFSPRKGTFTTKMRFMQMMYPKKIHFWRCPNTLLYFAFSFKNTQFSKISPKLQFNILIL